MLCNESRLRFEKMKTIHSTLTRWEMKLEKNLDSRSLKNEILRLECPAMHNGAPCLSVSHDSQVSYSRTRKLEFTLLRVFFFNSKDKGTRG